MQTIRNVDVHTLCVFIFTWRDNYTSKCEKCAGYYHLFVMFEIAYSLVCPDGSRGVLHIRKVAHAAEINGYKNNRDGDLSVFTCNIDVVNAQSHDPYCDRKRRSSQGTSNTQHAIHGDVRKKKEGRLYPLESLADRVLRRVVENGFPPVYRQHGQHRRKNVKNKRYRQKPNDLVNVRVRIAFAVAWNA
jgi:hypothetical protein